MKRIYAITVILGALGWTAAAQDADAQKEQARRTLEQLQKQMADLDKLVLTSSLKRSDVNAAVMGPTVKGAPYSGIEIMENTQVLGDGTRIHNETQTTVYRDSEGRVRRETPDQITIWDPVANTSYILNPREQTARKVPLTRAFLNLSVGGKGGGAVELRTYNAGEPVQVQEFGVSTEPPQQGVAEYAQKAKAIISSTGRGGRGGFQYSTPDGKPQSLGHQVVEGVDAIGERVTSTTPAGAIGNDRPIETLSEHWDSPDLQTTIKNVHSDPRTGENTFRLTNISRVEPAPYLFQIPAGYQMIERK